MLRSSYFYLVILGVTTIIVAIGIFHLQVPLYISTRASLGDAGAIAIVNNHRSLSDTTNIFIGLKGYGYPMTYGPVDETQCWYPLKRPCDMIMPAGITAGVFSNPSRNNATFGGRHVDALILPSVKSGVQKLYRNFKRANPFALTAQMLDEPRKPAQTLESVVDLSCTYRKSTAEIPRIYFDKDYWLMAKSPAVVDNPDIIKGGLFMASHAQNPRDRYVKYFINRYPNSLSPNANSSKFVFDSGGIYLHKGPWPSYTRRNDAWNQSKYTQTRMYMFSFAFESFELIDYVTEKLRIPLQTGVVPVYLGAPNVDEFVPKRSTIKVSDFKTMDELAEYLERLVENRTEYMSYFDWLHDETMTDHLKWMNPFTENWRCRFCRYVEGIRYFNKTKKDWNRLEQKWK